MPSEYPVISIVIPSYNHGKYIEETIRSVLLQDYQRLELIILDAGSEDGTIEIIEKYEKWISYWRSHPDGGQVAAIGEGFERANGEIVNWLNSDDVLLPNALEVVATMYRIVPDSHLFVGARIQINEEGIPFRVQDSFSESWPSYLLGVPDFPQEAAFFTKEIFKEIGFDARLKYKFDTALYWRILAKSSVLVFTQMPMSKFRVYPAMKTLRYDASKSEEDRILRNEYAHHPIIMRILGWAIRAGIILIVAKLWNLIAGNRRISIVQYDVLSRNWVVQKYS